ncbi:NAD(P)/FAD-dependent oxidoreductase [Flavobacterium sp. GT3R68]|uniref:phytoene desaturase family protein n=1 Tax=Flavobacterium sp. GT3R68 TaxID=2594437 RepID=UPI000F892271|nr:NAD(P)/FAD-dependent oxidoreductase [Flavobacterium sp. GT3R68]RTY93918.1 NAD(P)/FAD-dependent oxidoreductase [Flavobacterium sp. GSN2]TRW93467.1 NAD(P)/FAD-dependent oxidoreductase [Flavobacterium sp. GT3R68]
MEEFDTIIIGSGAGGLAAALCLAKAGQKVLVLEQHTVPGGWSHSFTLNGQRFSPGVHYIGLLDEGQSTSELYKGLGVANDLVFFRMNKNAYDHCIINNQRFDYPAGIENLKNRLIEQFPKEEKNIKEYLNLIQKVCDELSLIPKLKGFWQNITVPFRTKHFGKFALFSLKRVIDWHIKDPVLKGILNAQCGDHGLPPSKASFPVHCSVMNHYFDGGFYPMGGGAGIVKVMTNKIKSYGGLVRTQQSVTRILVQNSKVLGVELSDGTQILAKNVISNADPTMTYLQLIGPENISKKLKQKLDKTTYSVTSLILFLTLDMDVTAAGIDSGNIWNFKTENIDEHFETLTKGNILEGDEFPAFFLSCTTLKDPISFNGRYHNFEVVTYVDYDSFKDFNHSDDYHGPEYDAFKTRIIEKLLNSVEKIIPGARQNIVQAELGTPKTNQFYVNTTRGNVYGTEKTLRQVGPFAYKNKTEISNLFLCGASTLSHGVTGATYSGIEAAARVLNCKSEELLIQDPNQQIRIYDAEDQATWGDFVHKKREDKTRHFKETKVN